MALFSRDKLILLTFLTGAHFLTHVMLVAYNAIAVVVGEDFSLEESNARLFAPITLTLVVYGCGALATGYLADRYEPLRMLSLGIGIATAASFLIALSVSYYMLLAGFVLLGVGLAFYHPVGLSFISKVFGPKNRGKALGINGIGGDVGWLASPIISATIAATLGWRMVYLFLGGLGVFFILVVLYLFGSGSLRSGEGGAEGRGSEGGRLKNGVVDIESIDSEETVAPTSAVDYRSSLRSLLTAAVLVVMLITLLRGFYFHGTTDPLPTFLNKEKGDLLGSESAFWQLILAGGYTTVLYLMGVIAEPLGGWLKDRYHARLPIVVCSLLNALSIALLIMSDSTALLGVAVVSFGFAFFMLMAVINALVADVTPPQVRGTFYGITFLTRDGIGAFAPLMVGLVSDSIGWETAYWIVALFAVLTALSALGVRRQLRAGR